MLHNLSQLSFADAIWLLPVVCLLHVLEELPRFPQWARKTLKTPYTRSKFLVENVVLFALLVLPILMMRLLPAGSLGAQVGLVLVLSAIVGVFCNVIFHAWFTLKTGEYSPGTVTACLLFAPASVYLGCLAAAEGLVTVGTGIPALVLGFVLLPTVVGVVHKLMDAPISRKTLVRFALLGVVPPLIIFPLGSMVFGADAMQKVLIYSGPLLLLPLVLKWSRPPSPSLRAEGPPSPRDEVGR